MEMRNVAEHGVYRGFTEHRNENDEVIKMRAEIAKEDKIGFQLDEKVNRKKPNTLFRDALTNHVDPKEIVFYSVATGILRWIDNKSEEIFCYANETPAQRYSMYIDTRGKISDIRTANQTEISN